MNGGGATQPADAGRGGAGSVPYPGIAPSTAVSVKAELDWRARHVGARVVVNSYADLEALYPAVGSVHTITGVVELTGTVTLPTDVRLVLTSTGALTSSFAVRQTISGSYAGALVSGTNLAIKGVTLVNANAAGSHVSGSGAGTTVLREVVCSGAAAVGQLANIANATIEGCSWVGCASGLEFAGAIGGVRVLDCSALSMPASAAAFLVAAAAAPTIGFAWVNNTMVSSQSGQCLVRIDAAASLPAGLITARLQNNAVPRVGAGAGVLLDPAGITEADARVLATGNLNGRRSLLLGHASFSDPDTPISKTYSASDTYETIPISNGVTSISLVATSQRYQLVQDGATWYLEYIGLLPTVTTRVEWVGTFSLASGASSKLTLRLEHWALSGGGWVAVPGSVGIQVQQINTPQSAGGFGSVVMTYGDRLRVTIANADNTASTRIFALSVLAEGTV
jgi:hypothetical protein